MSDSDPSIESAEMTVRAKHDRINRQTHVYVVNAIPGEAARVGRIIRDALHAAGPTFPGLPMPDVTVSFGDEDYQDAMQALDGVMEGDAEVIDIRPISAQVVIGRSVLNVLPKLNEEDYVDIDNPVLSNF